jgi:hypothetical protein
VIKEDVERIKKVGGIKGRREENRGVKKDVEENKTRRMRQQEGGRADEELKNTEVRERGVGPAAA